MSNQKVRATGFTRLIIFLLIVAPLAYIAASYIRGEDGIQNIKNLFGGSKSTTPAVNPEEAGIIELEEVIKQKKYEIEDLKKENEALKKELEALKANQ